MCSRLLKTAFQHLIVSTYVHFIPTKMSALSKLSGLQMERKFHHGNPTLNNSQGIDQRKRRRENSTRFGGAAFCPLSLGFAALLLPFWRLCSFLPLLLLVALPFHSPFRLCCIAVAETVDEARPPGIAKHSATTAVTAVEFDMTVTRTGTLS